MPRFIRHCVECPKCLTRYLVAFSPYANGSYLTAITASASEEYILYCTCRTPLVSSRWNESELKRCVVSKAAHDRGYGTAQEVVPVGPEPRDAVSLPAATRLEANSHH